MYADCYKILGNVETKKNYQKKFNVTEKIEILNAHINVSCDVMVVDWTFFSALSTHDKSTNWK